MAKLISAVVPAGSMSSTRQPEVAVGDDLLFRPFTASDFRAIIEAYTTPDIERFHFHRIDTEDEAVEWIDRQAKDWESEKAATWAVVDGADVVLGRVTIYTDLEGGRGEVSYWTLERSRGRSVATRSCGAATDWAHELGIERVQLQHSAVNEISRRVARRSGFIEEGGRRRAVLHPDGWHDMVVHSRLRGEPI